MPEPINGCFKNMHRTSGQLSANHAGRDTGQSREFFSDKSTEFDCSPQIWTATTARLEPAERRRRPSLTAFDNIG